MSLISRLECEKKGEHPWKRDVDSWVCPRCGSTKVVAQNGACKYYDSNGNRFTYFSSNDEGQKALEYVESEIKNFETNDRLEHIKLRVQTRSLILRIFMTSNQFEVTLK